MPLFPDRLESAVARQHVGLGDISKYTKPTDVAATLFYGLTMCHAFENGNKRTALVTLLVFLDRTGFSLVDTTADDLYELVTNLAAHQVLEEGNRDVDAEVRHVSDWLKPRMQRSESGDRVKRFRVLRRVLRTQGCEFDDPDGNYITIRRGNRKSVVGFPRHDFDVSPKVLKQIRRDLGLAEADGMRSNELYDLTHSVDEFVREYRSLLDRLSEL